MNDIFSVLNQQ